MLRREKKAKSALNKPARYGPDLDLSKYRRIEERGAHTRSDLAKEASEQAIKVGVDLTHKDRAGTYLQVDQGAVLQLVKETYRGVVEVTTTSEALGKHPWLKDYWWKAVPVDADKYTALAELEWDEGYFVRVLPGKKVTMPIQSCLLISNNNLDQNVHNIIILEPGSEAQLITGCSVHPNVKTGLHVGVSEFYIKEDAKLTFTMVHGWAEEMDVRPRTVAILEDGATFINNYVCTRPVKSLQAYPTAYCRGAKSRVSFNTLIYGSKSSSLDVGSKVVLEGEDSRGEIVTRAIATDNSKIYARGMLIGENPESRGHLECRGLLLSGEAELHAVPQLTGEADGTELSHEAAVG
jgi:Fe-S cluster assembly scaffold protein SufB